MATVVQDQHQTNALALKQDKINARTTDVPRTHQVVNFKVWVDVGFRPPRQMTLPHEPDHSRGSDTFCHHKIEYAKYARVNWAHKIQTLGDGQSPPWTPRLAEGTTVGWANLSSTRVQQDDHLLPQ